MSFSNLLSRIGSRNFSTIELVEYDFSSSESAEDCEITIKAGDGLKQGGMQVNDELKDFEGDDCKFWAGIGHWMLYWFCVMFYSYKNADFRRNLAKSLFPDSSMELIRNEIRIKDLRSLKPRVDFSFNGTTGEKWVFTYDFPVNMYYRVFCFSLLMKKLEIIHPGGPQLIRNAILYMLNTHARQYSLDNFDRDNRAAAFTDRDMFQTLINKAK